ncbi:unnamed protein product [Eruca vesicaria subsp. sativa]|uniref:Uncharacterized protein n=1 Tax=Eruca vesicaria subsp. sativa TaxID=29727 RepID=A0ABC8LB18_ERUVS|nr:unnamed protein product [Eruca vesicaria subsp. sativa]
MTNQQLTEIVLTLQKQMKQMHKTMKKMKRKAQGRRSSFHKVLSHSKKHRTSQQEGQRAPFDQDVDAMENNTDTVHSSPDHRLADDPDPTPLVSSHISNDSDLSIDDLNPKDKVKFNRFNHFLFHIYDFDEMENDNQDVHPSPVHDTNNLNASTNGNDDDIYTTPVRPDQKTTETRTFRKLYPGQWDPPSKIYDKADHPDSPEINHILYHGLRIYDKTAVSPDPPLSSGPISDQTAGPSSPPRIRLRLAPLPFTPLTSPVKSNESGLGFVSHATTPNAFKATFSSNSPPGIGPTSEDQDPFVDLTTTKDPARHVPSPLENLLAKELFNSPLIPALDLITPLPDREWGLFHSVLKTNIDVFHSTPYEFQFSNKLLLEIAQPKQWTTSYVRHPLSVCSIIV